MNARLEERLAELGLALPAVVRPVAAYIPAVVVGNLCFTSGQLPFRDGKLTAQGRVGGAVSLPSGQAAAQQAALNALSAAADAVGGLEALSGVVKLTGFVQASPDFAEIPQVIDGASKFLESIFGDSGRHARSAIGVAALPLDAPVEIECVFRLSDGAHG